MRRFYGTNPKSERSEKVSIANLTANARPDENCRKLSMEHVERGASKKKSNRCIVLGQLAMRQARPGQAVRGQIQVEIRLEIVNISISKKIDLYLSAKFHSLLWKIGGLVLKPI